MLIKYAHNDLFEWLRSQNFPERNRERKNKEWFREIAVGFSVAGIKVPDLREFYEIGMEEIESENIKRIMRVEADLGLVDYPFFENLKKREVTKDVGFFKPNLIQSVDFVCIVGNLEERDIEETWILEGKSEPSHTAIGQVLVYEDLFKKDYPNLGETKRGIVCKEYQPLNEPTCKKLEIKLFKMAE